MAYTWIEYLETGDETLDQEHKAMFEEINSLLDACARGEGERSVRPVIQFLENYITIHLQREEQLMLAYDYPRYEEHRRHHEEFTEWIYTIMAEYVRDGASVQLVAKLNSIMTSWVMFHMKKEDARFAGYLRRRRRIRAGERKP